MYLIIKKSFQGTENMKIEIWSLEQFLKDRSLLEGFETKIKEMEEQIRIVENKLKDYELKKYNWNAKDYLLLKVYKWCSVGSSSVDRFCLFKLCFLNNWGGWVYYNLCRGEWDVQNIFGKAYETAGLH